VSNNNLFDDLGFSEAPPKTQNDIIDHLIHQTFAQNPAGAELIVIWERALIMSPTARPGDDLLQIGINEGVKQFVRNIKLTIEKVESSHE